MELLLRIVAGIATFLALCINTVLNWVFPRQKPTYPPIRNKLLTKSVSELIVELRQKKVTSEELVQAYITRIKEVDPSLNAVVENRFGEALKEAQHADKLIAKLTTSEQLQVLFARYPLLGIPFTVKESCGVKGLSYTIGSMSRKGIKCEENGEVVELLRTAGCIPLLVSANPEFCLSFETKTHINGKCVNPYDLRRTSAGSSGGEGALNGAGATLFGLGSDIAGSIRLPAMFCGVFGHKPTGGLLSVKGHFPHSDEAEFAQYLQLGPITRFARDLPLLLTIMAGSNADKLKFHEGGVQIKDIKIHYAYGFDGLNALLHPPTAFDIKLSITRAVKCFEKGGLFTKEVQVKGFHNSMEIALTGLVDIKRIPSIITQSTLFKPRTFVLFMDLLRSLIGHSLFTREALFMELMQSVNAFMSQKSMEKWRTETKLLKEELLNLLGTDGVLLFPTFHTPATCFNTSILNLVGVDMLGIFNVLGFPSTHIPMGLDHKGMPIGFQVIAAPYQDKLCLQIAAELEVAFDGWVPPLRNEIDT